VAALVAGVASKATVTGRSTTPAAHMTVLNGF
jgi:hypothetical protein